MQQHECFVCIYTIDFKEVLQSEDSYQFVCVINGVDPEILQDVIMSIDTAEKLDGLFELTTAR